ATIHVRTIFEILDKLLGLNVLAVVALIFDMLEVPSGTNVEYASLTFCFKNYFLAQETLQKCVGSNTFVTPKMEDDSQTSKKILKPMSKQETLIIYDASWPIERKPPYMFKTTLLVKPDQ
ncbi:hypothetical protein ACJX0J_034286, partial [Zea mays]